MGKFNIASLLADRTQRAVRFGLVGVHGVGKSTMVARAPGSIMLPVEDGADETQRYGCKLWDKPESITDVREAIMSLVNDPHDYKVFGLDGIEALEALIWEEVCKEDGVTSIEKVGKGYGKGYTEAVTKWRGIFAMLDKLRDQRGMHVVLIGHTQIRPYNDPSQPEAYDRHELRIQKHAAGALSAWVDALGFAFHGDHVVAGARRAVASGDRLLRLFHSASVDCKNRYGIDKDLPLDWGAFIAAVQGSRHSVTDLKAQVEALILQDPDTYPTHAKWLKATNDPGKLYAALEKLKNKKEATTNAA